MYYLFFQRHFKSYMLEINKINKKNKKKEITQHQPTTIDVIKECLLIYLKYPTKQIDCYY